jgi:hypothetical protein
VNHFDLIVPCLYNPWLNRCLDSILKQDYPFFSVHVIIDPPIPKMSLSLNSNNHEVSVTINEDRSYPLENTVTGINNPSIKKESIIVIIDGDDTLYDNAVLSKINCIYEMYAPLLTYGGMLYTSGIGPQFEFEKTVTETQKFRKSNDWVFHLRTFRKWLFEKINPKDFLDESGNYFTLSGDRAYMYPMIEMAGPQNIYHTNFPCYNYNDQNPQNDHRINKSLQENVCFKIQQKPIYAEL